MKKSFFLSTFENCEIYRFLQFFPEQDLKFLLQNLFFNEHFSNDITKIVFTILYRYLEYFFCDTFYQNGRPGLIEGKFTDVLISSLVIIYENLNNQINYDHLIGMFPGKNDESHGLLINMYCGGDSSRSMRINCFLESINNHPELYPFFNAMYKVFYKNRKVFNEMQKMRSGIGSGLQQAYLMTNPGVIAKLPLTEEWKKIIRPYYYWINRIGFTAFLLLLLKQRKKIISCIPKTWQLQLKDFYERISVSRL